MVNWFEVAIGFVAGFSVAAIVLARLDAIRVEQIDELRDELAKRDGADELALRRLP